MLQATFALALTFSTAYAGSCRQAAVTLGGSAAALSMLSGYSTVREYIMAQDLERMLMQRIDLRSTNWLYNREWKNYESGQRATIVYSRDPHLNRMVTEMRATRTRLSDLGYQIAAARQHNEVLARHNNRARLQQGQEYLGSLEQAKRNNTAHLRMLENNVAREAPRNPIRLTLNVASKGRMAERLAQMSAQGMSVYTIEYLPSAVARRFTGASLRHGAILAATAVTLGLISAEELVSGRIACYREAEVDRMRGNR